MVVPEGAVLSKPFGLHQHVPTNNKFTRVMRSLRFLQAASGGMSRSWERKQDDDLSQRGTLHVWAKTRQNPFALL